jgi:hypothetical protein
MLKRNFSDSQKYGFSEEEIRVGTKYLRKNKTAGAIPQPADLKVYEMFMLGHSFLELSQQFPQYPIAQVILTAALRGWNHDRDKMQHTLRDRVQARVIKSVVEQVDFLTTVLSTVNVEHIDEMRRFILDPVNNPKPSLRIVSLKEYKDVIETLYKIVAGAIPNSRSQSSPLFNALAPPARSDKEQVETLSPAQMIAQTIEPADDADDEKD